MCLMPVTGPMLFVSKRWMTNVMIHLFWGKCDLQGKEVN